MVPRQFDATAAFGASNVLTQDFVVGSDEAERGADTSDVVDVTARLCRGNYASFNIYKEDISVAQRGTVKWFNSQKGFGFIQPEGGGNDVFVHISAVEQAGLSQLNENQRVSFETETGRNGR